MYATAKQGDDTPTEQLTRYVAVLKVPADTPLGYTEKLHEVEATKWYVDDGDLIFYVAYQGAVFAAGRGTWARVEEAAKS